MEWVVQLGMWFLTVCVALSRAAAAAAAGAAASKEVAQSSQKKVN